MSILDYVIPGWKKNRLKVEAARLEREMRERRERDIERQRVRDALAASHAAYIKTHPVKSYVEVVKTPSVTTKASARPVDDGDSRPQVSDSSDDTLRAVVAMSTSLFDSSSSYSSDTSSSSCYSSSSSSYDSSSSSSSYDSGSCSSSSDW